MKRSVHFAMAVVLALVACCSAGCSPAPSMGESARVIACEPALGDGYDRAYAAIAEKASDAQLVAVRSSTYASAGNASEWMYLFYSWDRARAYTAFVVDGEAVAGEYAGMAFTQDDLAEAPGAADVAIDADEAYSIAVDSLGGDGSVYAWRAYLVLFTEEGDASEDDMSWVFQFNGRGDVEDLEKAVGSSYNDVAEPFSVGVDARTGAVRSMGNSGE